MKKTDKKNIEDILALTPMQQGMLSFYLGNPGSPLYFEQLSVTLSGVVDPRHFAAAWASVTAGNEMMRAVFRWEAVKEPVQLILKRRQPEIRTHDFSDVPAHDIPAKLETVKRGDRAEGFDLQDVAFRVTLCKVGDRRCVMLVSHHHILYDGWSNGIVLSEFFTAYRALSAGESLPEPVKTPFKVFLDRQGRLEIDDEASFWRTYLAPGEPVSEDQNHVIRRRASASAGRGEYRTALPGALYDGLSGFAVRHQWTLSSLYYAAWGLVSGDIHGRGDVVFDTTVSGRPEEVKGIDEMVGLFINTLPMRVRFDEGETYETFLSRFTGTLLERRVFENGSPLYAREYLERYRRVLPILFDSVVVVENYPLDRRLMGGGGVLEVESFSDEGVTPYDLALLITDFEERPELRFTYNSELFDESLIRDIAARYIAICKEFFTPTEHTERHGTPLRGDFIRQRFLEVQEPFSSKKVLGRRRRLFGFERRLAEVWSEVLGIGVDLIGVDSEFFEFGGHSLKASMLAARLYGEMGVKIPLAEVFRHASLGEMARYIEGVRGEGGAVEELPLEPVEEREYYPQSSAQQRLYMLHQAAPESTVYNGLHVWEIEGPLDRERLEGAFNALIEAHESLRTSFHIVDGEPVQQIHNGISFEIPGVRNKEFGDRGEQDFLRPFDLSCAPLLRVGLIDLEPSKHLLLVDMHHIITDGISTGVLLTELGRLYGMEKPTVSAADRQAAPVRYRDYSLWRQRRLKSGELRGQAGYWEERLAGDLPVLNLPSDFADSRYNDYTGDTLKFTLEPPVLSLLNRTARETGATLYMFLLAVFNILLSRYTGQEDILVGTPTAGRNHRDLENVVGLFMDGVVMRNRPEVDKTFEEFLAEVRAGSLAAFDNADFPLGEVMRRQGGGSLFDAMLIVQNQAEVFLRLDGLTVMAAPRETKTAKTALTLEASEKEGRLECLLEYAVNRFKKTTIQRMAGHLFNILTEVLDTPSVRLSEIEMISEAERLEILERFNRESRVPTPSATVHGLFEARVDADPDAVALEYEDEILTYRELDERADLIAFYLLEEIGLEPSGRVGILMDKSIEMIPALLGTMKAGGIYVPMDSVLPPARLKHMIDDSGLRVILSQQGHRPFLDRLQWECESLRAYLCLDTDDVHGFDDTETAELDRQREVWDFIGERAEDSIQGGGWLSSYTGEPFSEMEMAEYTGNVFGKISPLLHKDMKVAEIGCATGLTMYRTAPHVGMYYGTDLSGSIIDWNRRRVEQEGIENIRLQQLPAHEISSLPERNLDLVIINSVIQDFGDYHYLRRVLELAISMLGEHGSIFIGDVMDLERKQALLSDLENFKAAHPDGDTKTKTDWEKELFVPRGFFEDLAADWPRIAEISFSTKIHTVENELTKFRYDVLLTMGGGKQGGEPRVPFIKKRKYQHDLRVLRGFSTERPGVTVQPEAPAYIIYTSGSTGVPKGVVVEHRNVVGYVKAFDAEFGLTASDVVLQQASHAFDVFVEEVFPVLSNGGRVAVPHADRVRDIPRLISFIADHNVTLISTSPRMLKAFNSLESRDPLRSVRIFISGGDVLTADCVDNLVKEAAVYNTYGPTESTVCATYYRCPEHVRDPLPIGRPIEGYRVVIVDKYSRLQPVGVPGELRVAGAGTARGYLNHPDLTAARYRSYRSYRSYLTGDLVKWLPDGDIVFLGRIDQQVKIRGYRIELGEIQHHIRAHRPVKEAVTTVQTDAFGTPALYAYIVFHSATIAVEQQVAGLREYLGRHLPDYMVPGHYIHLEHMPLTPSGKPDKQALASAGKKVRGAAAHEAPADSTEAQLAVLWREVLGAQTVGVHDDFFELGGHSLNAVALATRIEKTFQVRLSLVDLFRSSTIRKIARRLKEERPIGAQVIQPADKQEYYPVSSAQKRLYLMHQSAPLGTAYHITRLFRLDGPVDAAALKKAFQALTERHESLRTSFHLIDGEPVQKIHRNTALLFTRLPPDPSLTPYPLSLIPRFIRPFDLSQAPLMRVGLFPLETNAHILALDIHHIVSDGVSMEVLAAEFMALMTGHSLPPPRLQYKDYAVWSRGAGAEALLERQETYWRESLSGELQRVELPTDYPRPAAPDFNGETLLFDVEDQTVDRLKTFAHTHGLTPYMLLSAVFNLLLAKLSGQDDILVGVPAAGRRNEDLEPLVGMFVNTLVLRNRPREEMLLGDFLDEVKQNTWEAFENQEYPFERLLDLAPERRDARRNPFFDVMFVMQNNRMISAPKTNGGKIPFTVTPYPFENKTAKFDLTLEVVERGDGLGFSFEYAVSLFREESVRIYARYFNHLLTEVCDEANRGRRLWEIELLSQEEKEEMVSRFNQTACDFPADKTIHQFFEEQAARTPDRTALLAHGTHGKHGIKITYKELNNQSDHLASSLIEKGVRPESIVAIMEERSLDMVIGILGILKAGGAYLPIEPDTPGERVRYILEDSGAILHKEKLCGAFSKATPRRAAGGSLAYVIYTSGSTGKPKGVMVEHRSVVNLSAALEASYPMAGGAYLFKTPYVFDVSVTELFGWFMGGGRLVVLPPGDEKDPWRIVASIETQCVTHVNFVPSMFRVFSETLDEAGMRRLHSLKYLFLAGEALLPEAVQDFMAVGLPVRVENLYGPTEATVYAGGYSLARWDGRSSIPIGGPLPNVRLYVLDKRSRLLPPGVVGELAIAGAGVARGYLNRPGGTAPFFNRSYGSDRTYMTGDLVKWLPDGNIVFLGRIDHQVKIRGYRIELGEIENRLLEHPGVRETVVVSFREAGGNDALCAYVVGGEAARPGTAALRTHLGRALPGYMVPAYFVVLDHLPMTSTGKIDRNALPRPERAVTEGSMPPRDRVEKQLAAIWEEVLQRTGVGIDDHFFSLGGHSLNAARVLLMIHKTFEVRVSLAELFQHPTIRQLAETVKNSAKTEYLPIDAVEEREYYPLSHAQLRLWVLSRMEGGGEAYNMPGKYEFNGPLDIPVMQAAVDALVQRHPVLRTTFIEIDGEPFQRVHRRQDITVETVDLREQTGIDTIVRTMYETEAYAPFDLSRDPLMRITCLTLEAERHVLLFTIHHIVSDGLSLDILASELTSLYDSMANGLGNPLTPLNLHYKDYAAWEADLLRSARGGRLEAFWAHHLGGSLEPVPLPTDKTGDGNSGFNGDNFCFSLDPAVADKCYEHISHYNVTAYAYFLALCNVLLAKLSQQQEITVVSGSSGRNHPDLEPLLGVFVRTFVIKNIPDPSMPFETFLSNVMARHVEVLAHDAYPFEWVIDRFASGGAERQAANVHYIYSDRPVGDHFGRSKAPFTFSVHDTAGSIDVNLQYNSDRFSRDKIRLLAAWTQNLLAQVSADPTLPLESYRLSSGTESELHAYFNVGDDPPAALYPLTPTQRDLYLNCKINPGGRVQRLVYYADIGDEVNRDAWLKAAADLHRVFPILNARAVSRGETVWLAISETGPVNTAFIDLSREHSPGEIFDIKERITELTARSHDLDEEWVRHYLFRISYRRYIAAVSAHHIIFDGLAGKLYFEALLPLLQPGAGAPAAYSNQRYIDFQARTAPRFDTPAVTRYWENALANLEKLRSNRASGVGGSQRVFQEQVIENSRLEALTAYCRGVGISVPLFFRALYGVLIRLYCGVDGDFHLREIIDGRDADTQSLAGCFYQATPLVFERRAFEGSLKPADFFQYVRGRKKELGLNQNISIFLQNRLIGEEDIAFYYNFQTFFKLDLPGDPFYIDDIMYYADNEIHLLAGEIGDGFRLELGYHEDYFDGSRFMDRLLWMAKQVVDGVETMSRLRVLLPDEDEQVLRPLRENAGPGWDDRTIHQIFDEQATKAGDNIALVTQGRLSTEYEDKAKGAVSITYSELNDQSDRVASLLIEKGVGPGDIVAIMMERSVEMIVGSLAILKAGAAYLPIDPAYPEDRKEYMLADSGANLLIDEMFCGAFSNGGRRSLPPGRAAGGALTSNRTPGLAYVIYTSGSTGRPKGVMVEHRNVVRLMLSCREDVFDFDANDVWTMFHSHCFDFSVWEMYGALLFGGRLVMAPRAVTKDPGKYLDLLERESVTVLNQTPSAFYALMDETFTRPGAPLDHLKYIIFGGEALSPGRLKGFYHRYPRTKLINMFGITETTIHVTVKQVTEAEIDSNGSLIGSALPHMRTVVVDDAYRPLPPGSVGELWVGGFGTARGYMNRPELTHEKFTELPGLPGRRFYRSGDRVRLLPGGGMEYLGRIDHQVQVRGFRIEPGEIQKRLLHHDGVKEAVVLAVENMNGDTGLSAYVRAEDFIDTALLRGYLGRELPDYMMPAQFILVDRFPLTPNGKIDREALMRTGFEAVDRFVAPADELEKQLAGIWAQVLGTGSDTISTGADFFSLGGHSLSATRLALEIQKELDVKIPLEEIFHNPFIPAMAAYIRSADKVRFAAVEPLEKREYYPLTPAQKRLFVLQQVTPDSTGYNLPAAFRVEGEFDMETIHRVFQQLIARHAALRTSFPLVNGEPVQKIHENTALPFAPLPPEPSLTTYPLSLTPGFIHPFDLSQAPLLRVSVVPTADGAHILAVDIHHIVADGVSLGILIREFMSLYSGESLVEPRIQYVDYTGWLRRAELNESFWLDAFETVPEPLALPLDFPRPAAPSFKGCSVSFTLGTVESQALETLARRFDMTLYMLLLAMLNVLLAKLSGMEDIVVGSPVENRRHADLQPVVGMFVNTLALRHYPDGEKTFDAFLAEVRRYTTAAFENQDYPFDDLVERVVRERDMARNPLFEVMLSLDNAGMPDLSIPGLRLAPMPPEHPVSKFDMTWAVSEVGEGLAFTVTYAAALFKRETIERFSWYFRKLAAVVLEDPRLKLKNIDMIPAEEKQEILETFNNTAVDYPADKTLHQLFAERAAQAGDEIALVGPGAGALTYRELNRQSDLTASLLIEKGVGPGSITAIIMKRSVEMIIGILGVLKTGAAYLPIEPTYPEDRKAYMLADSGAKIVLSRLSELSELSEVRPFHAPRSMFHAGKAGAAGLAYVIYTSGSTGRPKGVMVEHRSAVNVVTWFARKYGVASGVHVLQMSDYTFDPSVNQIFGSLLHGAALYMIEKELLFDIPRLRRFIAGRQIHILNFVPQVLHELLTGGGKLDSVRFVLSGGEKLDDEVKTNIVGRGYRLVNQYGPTETTVDALAGVCTAEPVNLGGPIANTRVYILDRYGMPVPLGVPGELYIAGAGVARGYLNRPELTHETFLNKIDNRQIENPLSPEPSLTPYPLPLTPRCYRTGDLVKWLPDGAVAFLGRIDQQVKIRGYRIELGEIEVRLSTHPAVGEAVVTAAQCETDTYLCAYFTAQEPVTPGELKDYLSGCLPDYMVPAMFTVLETIPLTSRGKTDRSALTHPELAGDTTGYEAPAGPLEERLLEIWREVLGDGFTIGATTSFFDCGGHSLKAVNLLSAVRKEFETDIPLAEFFKTPFIRDMAADIGATGSYRHRPVAAVEKRAYYPVSAAQKRLYVLQQLAPESTGYNLPAAFSLKGSLSVEKLEDVFQQLVSRHTALRTSFAMVDGNPVQQIHESTELSITLLPPGPLLSSRFIRPFDLFQAPLMHVSVVPAGDGSHILAVDIHHIVADGISLGILIREFMSLYHGEALPEPKVRYIDYTGWLGVEKPNETFWLSMFETPPEPLNLPVDFPRPTVPSYDGGLVSFDLGSVESKALDTLARGRGVTLYMLLSAIFNVLLGKLSGMEDIVVGTPVANRGHADLKDVVGMFVNTLALRHFPRGDKTFTTFLEEVKQNTLTAFEHQDYPFDELVDRVYNRRDMARNPLFDVMFELLNLDTPEFAIPGLQLTPIALEHRTEKFDMTWVVSEVGETLAVTVSYAAGLYSEETIERFTRYFKTLTAAVLETPWLLIRDIDIIPAEEKRRILETFNDTAADYPSDKSIHQLFEEQASRSGDRIALNSARETREKHEIQITYNELNNQSDHLAWLLIEKGVGPESVVAIMVEPSPEMITGILGILKTGAAYLPIDPDIPEERVRYMLADSGSTLLINENFFKETFCGGGRRLQSIGRAAGGSLTSFGTAGLAYVIYTSGTTGRPKGVAVSRRNLVNYVTWFSRFAGLGAEDAGLLLSSFAFDLGNTVIFPPLATGGRVHLVPRAMALEPEHVVDVINEQGISYLKLTPSLFGAIVGAANFSASKTASLRLVVLGGEAIDMEVVERVAGVRPGLRIINHYGPTEATIGCVARYVDTKSSGPATIGTPIDNMQVYILDRYGAPVPLGVSGELYIAGAGVAHGYLNRPELTADRFVVNNKSCQSYGSYRTYRTGDQAMWLPDGNIRFLGRIDQQVKIRGYRVEPAEIEQCLLKHPSVKETAVIARKIGRTDVLCAYIVSGETADDTLPAALNGFLIPHLPTYMIPSHFILVPALPLTANGKLDRGALPEPVPVQPGESPAPRGEIESILADVWREVLEVERPGIRDNFFHLGGDSIKAIRMVSQLRKYGLTLDVKTLFEAPTIEAASRWVKPIRRVIDQSPVEGAVRLTPIQRSFFLGDNPYRHHYNQSMMLFRRQGFDESLVKQVFQQLVIHHDALRMVFTPLSGGGVEPVNRGLTGELFHMEIININGSEDIEARIETAANLLQQGINLETGPLVRLGLFITDGGHYLLTVVHHLVMDGVSWRILLEDFTTSYRQLENGETVRLPEKTDSFKYWADTLRQYARRFVSVKSKKITSHKNYWETVTAAETDPAPVDAAIEPRRLLWKDNRTLDIQLDPQDTETLLKDVHIAYNTEINDILLAALASALQRWGGMQKAMIYMEGHGREALGTDVDTSRTIGWFTSRFPILLESSGDSGPGERVKQVKETLRRVPEHGVGYGVMVHMAADDTDNTPRLTEPEPEIGFNYLGQVRTGGEDGAASDALFTLSGMKQGERISPGFPNRFKLNMNSVTAEGRFTLSVTYNTMQYREETVGNFARLYKESLLELIRHCTGRETGELTPSDVGASELTMEQLDDIADMLEL